MSQDAALNWLAELFSEPEGTLSPDTPRNAISNWDSLGVLTLMAALDERFGLVVNDTTMRSMQKAGDVLELLRSNGKLN